MGEEQEKKYAGLILSGLIVLYIVIEVSRDLFPIFAILSAVLTVAVIWDSFSGYRTSDMLVKVWLVSIGLTFLLGILGYGITSTEIGSTLYESGETLQNGSSEITEAQLEAVETAEESTQDVYNETEGAEEAQQVQKSTETAFSLTKLLIRIEGMMPTFP